MYRTNRQISRLVQSAFKTGIEAAYVVALAIFLLGFTGCGLTLNSNAGPPVKQTTGEPGIPVGQAVPIPTELQPLTGCTNPNTGVSSGDWGTGTDPVYTLVNNTLPIVGAPIYTSNAIFWTSRENAPGQSVLLAGAFTDAAKTVRVAFIPPGTGDWRALAHNSTTIVAPVQQATTGLSFIVPSGFPAGVYGFEVDDPSAQPVLGLANTPLVNWAIGIPSATGAETALQHQVYDCGAETGGTLRLFGKNFVPSNQVVLQSSAGVAYSLAASKLDTNSITVSIPAGLPRGQYNLWVGGSPWSVTSSPAAQITLYEPSPFHVQNVTCSGLVGDGATDNVKQLQACLDRYAPPPGANNFAVYITIPVGNFVISGEIKPHSFEVLLGTSPTATNFIGQPRGAPPAAWFDLPGNSGMANLSLEAPANPSLLHTSGTLTGDPLKCGHLFFSNLRFVSTADISNGAENMFAIAGPDIQVYNSSFKSDSNQVFDIFFGDGGIVSGNHFVLNHWTGLGITDSQNQIFENNTTDSDDTPNRANNGNSAGSGLSVSRGNSQWGQSALSRDVYIAYNTFQNMGSNDQQIITNDGDGGAYLGPVSSSTASTVTLAADPAWNWMGTTNPQASEIAIVFGTGVGQYSILTSYSGRNIHLATPWKVLPDETSIVVIAQYEQNMTIAHNAITNTLGGSIVLGDALESVIEDNVMTNAGQGILISAFGPYGGPAAYGPVMNTDVLRNVINVGAGNLIALDQFPYLWGIGIQDFPGCLLSGLMVRDNVVPSVQVIYNTDGVNGISANVIEQNQANWAKTFTTPGFLVQNNTPPPP